MIEDGKSAFEAGKAFGKRLKATGRRLFIKAPVVKAGGCQGRRSTCRISGIRKCHYSQLPPFQPRGGYTSQSTTKRRSASIGTAIVP